jgi:hypothetical protein
MALGVLSVHHNRTAAMGAIDTTIDDSLMAAPNEPHTETPHTGWVVFASVLISAGLAAASVTIGIGNQVGWPLAAEIVGRFSVILFVAAMVVEPLSRLIPTRFMHAVGQERSSLILGFAATTAISLICAAAPTQMVGGDSLPLPTLAYCLLTAMVVAVMLSSAHPATIRFLGAPAWRAMQRIATTYFWLAFTITALGHLVGPHRPDSWHGASLLLLAGALLVRFTDTLVAHWRRRAVAKT